MTCDGCGRAETLLDGHYCGGCSGEIARAVRSALDDSDVVDVDIVHATYINENERLTIELVREHDD